MLRTGSRPRRQINVNYFYPSDENPTFKPPCSAAECPQHSLAEAERIFPKGPGVSRSQQTGKSSICVRFPDQLSLLIFLREAYLCWQLSPIVWTSARSVFVMTFNLSSMNSCAKRTYTYRKHLVMFWSPMAQHTVAQASLKKWYYLRKAMIIVFSSGTPRPWVSI